MGFSSEHEFIAEAPPRWRPRQVVCLEHETSYLYAEVIQIIEHRQLCWARPLLLILQPTEATIGEQVPLEQLDYYDLRQDSDLLLPLALFRAAFDTEVFSWIASLYADERDIVGLGKPYGKGHQLFKQLVQNVWQAHPDVFQNGLGSDKT